MTFFIYGPLYHADGTITRHAPVERRGVSSLRGHHLWLPQLRRDGLHAHARSEARGRAPGAPWASFDFRQLPVPRAEDNSHRDVACRTGFPWSPLAKYKNTLSVVRGGWRSSKWTEQIPVGA